MSSRQQSSAAVTRVKGVSFNYLQFLWKRLDLVAHAREQGNDAVALKLATGMIAWLPKSMKDEFMDESLQIQNNLQIIRSNRLKELQKITDLHERTHKRNWLLAAYSSAALTDFINKLSNKLDALGYMENTKTVTEGTTEGGDGDWAEYYQQNRGKGKGRRKREEIPTGTVT